DALPIWREPHRILGIMAPMRVDMTLLPSLTLPGRRPSADACSIPFLPVLTFPVLLLSALLLPATASAQIIGELVDVSDEFERLEQTYYVGARVSEFDAASGEGLLQWDRYERRPSLSFNKLDVAFSRAQPNEFPGTEYDRDPILPFAISFVSPRTVRLRFSTRDVPIEDLRDEPSLMLAGPVPSDDSWQVTEEEGAYRFRSEYGEVRLIIDPWHIEFYDADGRLLTRTQTLGDPAS